jgi:hypothetical protein
VGPLVILALLKGLFIGVYVLSVRVNCLLHGDIEVSVGIAEIHACYSHSEHEIGAIIKTETGIGGIFLKVGEVLGNDVLLGRYLNGIGDKDGPEYKDDDQAQESASEGAVAVLSLIAKELRGTEHVYFP